MGAQRPGRILALSEKIAAIVPIGGNGNNLSPCDVKEVPCWAFHGEDDPNSKYGSINIVNNINACAPAPEPLAKLTLYPGVSYDSWTNTYNGQAGHDVFAWMLQYDLSTRTNALPVANAGLDDYIAWPGRTVTLTGTATDFDGEIAAVSWKKLAGPATYTIQYPNRLSTVVSGLSRGDYVFQLQVADDKGGISTDKVNITVAAPEANADCDCDFVIPTSQKYVDGENLPGLKPGNVICLAAGLRTLLMVKNVHGSAAAPVTIKNCGGLVFFKNDVDNGIFQFWNSTHFRVTGSGSDDILYGIKIGKGGVDTAIKFGGGCSDFEADHIEVAHAGFAGIMVKSDPICRQPEYWRENFVMNNVRLHHNYVHDTYGEGFYVGHYAYRGLKTDCGILYPHLINNLKIYSNHTLRTGAEGIDVGCASEGCEIYNNVVEEFGISPFANYQNNGMIAGGGTSGLIYNNIIKNGPGNGLQIFGIGNNIVFNNLIINAGYDGIYANDGEDIIHDSYVFVNNTIINPKHEGIRASNEYISHTVMKNNIVVSSGASKLGGGNELSNNLLTDNPEEVNFIDFSGGNFRLLTHSPAIDAGADMSAYGVSFDFDRVMRGQKSNFDIGAFEYDPAGGKLPEVEKVFIDAEGRLILEDWKKFYNYKISFYSLLNIKLLELREYKNNFNLHDLNIKSCIVKLESGRDTHYRIFTL